MVIPRLEFGFSALLGSKGSNSQKEMKWSKRMIGDGLSLRICDLKRHHG